MLLILLIAVALMLVGAYLVQSARRAAQAAAVGGQTRAFPNMDRSTRTIPAPDTRPTPSPRPEPGAAPPPIDRAVLDRLRAADDGNGAAVVPALINSFLHGGPAQLDTIQAALPSGDPIPALASLSLFRTSARLLGATALETLAGHLQTRLDAGDSAALTPILQHMRAEFDAVASELRTYARVA